MRILFKMNRINAVLMATEGCLGKFVTMNSAQKMSRPSQPGSPKPISTEQIQAAVSQHASSDKLSPWAILDYQGQFQLVSQGLANLLGLAPQTVIGHAVTEYLPETQASFARQMHRLIVGGLPEVSRAWSLQLPSGQLTKAEVDLSRCEDESGNFFVLLYVRLPDRYRSPAEG
jgi:PAS domain S-box-containing protein